MWTYRCPPSVSPSNTNTIKEFPRQTETMSMPSMPVPAVTQSSKRACEHTATPGKEKEDHVIRSKSPTGHSKVNLLVSALYLLGLGLGIAAVQSLPQVTPFLTLYGRNLAQTGAQAGADMLFSMGFLGYIGVLLALLLVGLCAFGSPLVLTLIFLRGLWESAYVALLYAQSGWQGVLLYTLVFWIPGLLCVGFQLQFAAEALRTSRLIRQNCLANGGPTMRSSVKGFLLRFLTFGALGVVVEILQVAFFLMFGQLFV